MDDAVTRALRACTVPVRSGPTSAPRAGSAFFVAPHLLLTCRHVVGDAAQVEIGIGEGWCAARVVTLEAGPAADLALLETATKSGSFARLGRRASLHDPVRALGFPVRNKGPHQEQITGKVEDLAFQHSDEPWKSGARLIKFKDSQVWGGFSGAPLFDEATRRVVGVVTATRDQASALGGLAVPAGIALERSALLQQAQREADWGATVWHDPPGAEGPFLEHYLAPGAPFFGRDAALAELDAWLAAGPPHALLVADAGMGKSSLLARWTDRLRGSAATRTGQLQLALVPISIRFGHAREEQVLATLAQRVAAWHGASSAGGGGARGWREAIADGLRIDAPAGVRLLLIVDGLDEAIGWHAEPTLFPRRLGHGVRLLVAARRLAGRDAAQWREHLGWDSGLAVTELSLDRLSSASLCAAAAHWWRLDAARADVLGRRLYALSGGEPLVAGLYFTNLDPATPPSPAKLATLPPGLDGVFQRWWEEQAAQWQQPASAALGAIGRNVFNVLAGAFEPLPRRVLLGLVRRLGECSGDELDDMLQRLARFVVGNRDGYLPSHPELARWRWRRLIDDGDARRIDGVFIAWCHDAIGRADEGQAVEPYAVRALARHLQRGGRGDPDEWRIVVGEGWRAQHQRLPGWPGDYLADLESARAACRASDAADLARGRPCRALAVLAATALGRVSVRRQIDRVSPRLAGEAVRHGLWSPARALEQVSTANRDDFPLIEALGVIAPQLDVAELERAMAMLAVQRDVGFGWDETLGGWALAAAAARCGAFDDRRLGEWAQSLAGPGAATALLGLAAERDGAPRRDWLARGVAALPDGESGATARTRLALGVRMGQRFSAADVRAAIGGGMPLGVASRLGFDETDPRSAAAALRIAWNWLDRGDRSRRATAIDAAVPAWLAPAAAMHDDWDLRLGALWDVCPVALARRLFRRVRAALARGGAVDSAPRTLFTAWLRFASRLPASARPIDDLPRRLVAAAFAGSVYRPDVRDLFAAAAALEEWRPALGELVHELRSREPDAVALLEVIADRLSPGLLDFQWQAVGNFNADWRERAMRPLLGALAMQGEAATRAALARADDADRGVEQHLLDAMLDALRGGPDATRRLAARRALPSFPADDGARAQLLSVFAAPLAPWPLDEVERWVPKGDPRRSLAMSWLLPYLEPAELVDPETPWQLALHREPDADRAAAAALRRIHAATGFDAALGWAAQMAEASGDDRGEWAALAVAALAPVVAADARGRLSAVAMAIRNEHARAEACAALLAHGGDGDTLWPPVEAELRQAVAHFSGWRVAAVLGRLSGEALCRALRLIDLDTTLPAARRAYYNASLWIDWACHLMPWTDEKLIEREFLPGGAMLRVDSSTDRNHLRAALAPRLLAFGRADQALNLAAAASGATVWRAHVAMLAHLTRVDHAAPFVAALRGHFHSDLNVFAVARELQHRADVPAPAVVHAICDALLDAADSDAQLRLYLATLAPLIERLGGDAAVTGIAEATRPRAGRPPVATDGGDAVAPPAMRGMI